MDAKQRAEVVNELRNARLALQRAEKAMDQIDDVADSEAAPDKLGPQKSGLLGFIQGQAAKRKTYEEQDETFFAAFVEVEIKEDLLAIMLRHTQLDVAPGATSVVNQEVTPARSFFDKILKMAAHGNISPAKLFEPFVKQLDLKTWADLDPTQDLIVVKYRTPAPVHCNIDVNALTAAIEQAKQSAGSVDEVVNALRARKIEWKPFDEKGKVNPTIVLGNVDARWLAVVNLVAAGNELADHLSIVEAAANRKDPWWTSAANDKKMPACVLELVRGQRKRAVIQRSEVEAVTQWATSLPGWDASQTEPLTIRDVELSDILAE